jgi:nucleotide-binding universal stress UspA family protein
MKTILVGTDFDSGSEKALQKACQFARSFNSRIHLLHVLEPVDEPDSEDPETEEFYAKLEHASLEKLTHAISQIDSLELTSEVRVGRRHPTILAVAEEMKADLIVLGSHPIAPDDQRIGTSHRVAVTANRPVLLVP